MYPTFITYLGFIVAALILGWAIFEISRRYFRQRSAATKPLDAWVKLDPTFESEVEKPLPDEVSDEDEDNAPEVNIQVRAQHNGHHSQSKKLF